jgi:phosphinothricin acetyltransferase
MQQYIFRPINLSDREEIIDLFNYYIENSYAAYPETRVPYQFFDLFLQACAGYPSVAARDADGNLAGFGMLRPHSPMPAFAHTAEITYFVQPGLTGKGLGSRMLACLETEGRKKGISVILASISSLNEGSIRFHAKNGFTECGRFRNVGKKRGTFFDTVWMQKLI